MLEVIALGPEEARLAEAAGADRIELISAFGEGGLTPGIGLVARTVRAVRIPVNVMVRPHARSFHYSEEDLEVMKAELRAIRSAGANGAVLGLLDARGAVDEARLDDLLACAGGLDVTFHRAVDVARDPVEAVVALAAHPAVRTVLTSGGPGRIEANTSVLVRMREAAGPLRIMAGGGLTHENLLGIVQATGLQDFHVGTTVRTGRTVDGALEPARVAELAASLAQASRTIRA